jgi:hypothetical protein
VKFVVVLGAILLVIPAIASPAFAAGCVKGAVIGGVVGHTAGHHAVAGAAVGCAVGHHEENKRDSTSPQPDR